MTRLKKILLGIFLFILKSMRKTDNENLNINFLKFTFSPNTTLRQKNWKLWEYIEWRFSKWNGGHRKRKFHCRVVHKIRNTLRNWPLVKKLARNVFDLPHTTCQKIKRTLQFEKGTSNENEGWRVEFACDVFLLLYLSFNTQLQYKLKWRALY